MKKRIFLIWGVIALCLLGGFQINKSYHNDKPTITVTTTFLGDIIKHVLPNQVKLNILMGPGVDPHIYQASPSDLEKIYNSDLVIFQGVVLEGKFSEILSSINNPKINILEASKDIHKDQLIQVSNHKGKQTYDPHIWFDPNLWSCVVNTVSEKLKQTFPQFNNIITNNTDKYLNSINIMKQKILEMVNQIPPQQRILVTAHDAFNYFGRFTGFKVEGIQGLSVVSEASTNRLQELVQLIVKNKIKAIFVENSVSPKMINALLEAVRANNFDIKIGGTLCSDSLGDVDSPSGTYVGMYEENMAKIKDALL